MLSRVAESVYWMAKYVERAENTARFVDVNLHLMLDMPAEASDQWQPLVITTGDRELFAERYGAPTSDNVIRFLTFDGDYPNSILSCVRSARENARQVREVISSEMWEQINRFYLLLNEAAARPDRSASTPYEFFSQLKTESHLMLGVTYATLSHGEAWHFARLGRLLERADKTTRILDVKYFMILPQVDYVGTPYDNIQWAAVLKSASALEMYRKRYRRITPTNVTEFLLLDLEFPRSVRFCLSEAEESLHAITGSPAGTYANAAERRLGRLAAEFDYGDIADIISAGLHQFLDGHQARLNDVGDAVFDTFFAIHPTAAAVATVSS